MRKILSIIILIAILFTALGCGRASTLRTIDIDYGDEQNGEFTVDDIKTLISEETYLGIKSNCIIKTKAVRENFFLDMSDFGGPQGYVENKLNCYTFISNNGNYYYSNTNYSHGMNEEHMFLRERQYRQEYFDGASLTVYHELYNYHEYTSDLKRYSEEYPVYSNLTKTVVNDKETFDELVHSVRIGVYDVFFHSYEEEQKITKENDTVAFEFTSNQDGYAYSYIGTINLKTGNLFYTETTYKEGVLDMEYEHSIEYGDFEIDYDTDKEYQLNQ